MKASKIFKYVIDDGAGFEIDLKILMNLMIDFIGFMRNFFFFGFQTEMNHKLQSYGNSNQTKNSNNKQTKKVYNKFSPQATIPSSISNEFIALNQNARNNNNNNNSNNDLRRKVALQL